MPSIATEPLYTIYLIVSSETSTSNVLLVYFTTERHVPSIAILEPMLISSIILFAARVSLRLSPLLEISLTTQTSSISPVNMNLINDQWQMTNDELRNVFFNRQLSLVIF